MQRCSMIPFAHPPDAEVVVPGSKSITNRALVVAALAAGRSRLDGVLFADDTEAMLGALATLGVPLEVDRSARSVTVGGLDGAVPAGPLELDVRLSGTTARFLAPLLALGEGPYLLDAAPAFRRRPMAPVFDALRQLGVQVHETGAPGHLPARLRGPGTDTGALEVPADVSSQFLSGLLLSAPARPDGLRVRVPGALVSRPYVTMTTAVMRAFGARVEADDDDTFTVAPGGYRGTTYRIEPDASAASYVLAAAAITGGRVRVPGLGRGSLQGDVGFAQVLARMGATVDLADEHVEVQGTGRLQGVDVDLSDLSDTAQTLAAVAVFASSPTRVRGIGFIRHKETDRVRAVVTELRRLGIDAVEEDDGFLVRPGTPRPGAVHTYEDHRMAMSFALLGLRVPGVEILDPGCVAKTFPDYFTVLESLRR
ncbi:3-phosphoshikimate 1-carboxyvinyltransferase [Egicoccus halophilus]|uniref:3-phosphoshikimate 1-carboxyvinyltransferase n=1 Tax=Egicoccus halophilus TaxID=1670830 RepID=UPI00197AF632|nr:3-phosphoshikimate 1-carboxyvinyltransferase [Egicoccus halophilus]